MEESKEVKPLSIFDIYKTSEIVDIKDFEGNTLKIEISKLTAYDNKLSEELFATQYDKHLEKYKAKAPSYKEELSKNADKERLIADLLRNEKDIMRQNSDLLDIQDKERMEPNEIIEARDKALSEWEAYRKNQLEGQSLEQLVENTVAFIVNGRALLDASNERVIFELCRVCRNVENHLPLFSNKSEDENYILNCSQDVINVLATAHNKSKMSQQELRKLVNDKDFLLATPSEKNSESQS